MGCGQCDQMSKLCFQYFAFYKIENMPNITKMYQNRINVLLNTNTPSVVGYTNNFEKSQTLPNFLEPLSLAKITFNPGGFSPPLF